MITLGETAGVANPLMKTAHVAFALGEPTDEVAVRETVIVGILPGEAEVAVP